MFQKRSGRRFEIMGPGSADFLELESTMLKQIEPMKLADLTRSLVQIPSVNPPGEEKQVAEFIASWFDKRHFDYVLTEATKDRPNVEVKLSGEESEEGRSGRKKTLVFNGHTDVVPVGSDWIHEPFGGDIEDGRVYGRGSGDMKGGLAAMMTVLELLKASGATKHLFGSIVFDAVVAEEISGPFGTYHMVKRGLTADFAVVGEPTDMTICTAHKGNITFEITTHGKAAHASVPQFGLNAIMEMQKVISALEEYRLQLPAKVNHPLLGSPTLNIGVISGGIKSNVVPDKCMIAAERRVVPPETLEDAKMEVQTLLWNLASQEQNLKYDLVFKQQTGPSELQNGRDGLEAVLSSFKQVTGKYNAKPAGLRASCDAYFLSAFAKIPTVIFGPGSLGNIHNHDEYVEIEELEIAAKVYALTALRLLA